MSSGAWSEVLAGLRVDYALRCRARIAECRGLLDLLEEDPRDEGALSTLLRHLHGMNGTGASYGYPEITAIAGDGERLVAGVLRGTSGPAGAAAGPSLRGECRTLLARLEEVLDETRAANGPGAGGEQAADAAPEPAPPAGPDLLVVEDDPAALAFLRAAASRDGFSVREASGVAAALSALDRKMPDGIVVDARLADGSGYDVVEEVRRRAGGGTVAVLAVSAVGDFLEKVEAIRKGADAFFEKPLEWSLLGQRLRAIVERSRPRGARILSVEDDPDQARFLAAVLAGAGYEVRSLADPVAFDAELAAFRPDLVLLDALLPGPSGYDLARWLRRSEGTSALPVLFLTTAADVASRVEALRAGADDILVKPVPEELLLSTVAARLDRSRHIQLLVDRDPLTGLLNRAALLEKAEGFVARHRRSAGRPPVLIAASLDGSDRIAERWNAATADRVRVGFASLMRRRLRLADTVGRLGEDQFGVLMDDIELEQAVRLAGRLLDEIAATGLRSAEGEELGVSFSAGVAPLPEGAGAREWAAAADEAMRRARLGGGGRAFAAEGAAGKA